MDLSWFRADPFFIFGFMVQILLVGYAIYVLRKVIRWKKLRGKMTDTEALAWNKAVNNPNAPQRPTREYVMGPARKREDER